MKKEEKTNEKVNQNTQENLSNDMIKSKSRGFANSTVLTISVLLLCLSAFIISLLIIK